MNAPDDLKPGYGDAGIGSGDGFQTLPEKLAGVLRRKILLGDFAPGANIPERETSAELGVSRTPLREALRILANEGLISIRPARSPIVANPTAKELTDLFSVMRVLEALAGEITCLHASDDRIASIAAIHVRLGQINARVDPVAFFQVDMDFHRAIVAASENVPLMKTHEVYNARLWRARFLTGRVRTDRDRILREHGDILEGIQARDTRWTSAMLDGHLRSANRKIQEMYAPSDAQDAGA